MAFSDDSLSIEPMLALYAGGRATAASPYMLHSYETGGIALSDASQGLKVQVWDAEVIDNSNVVLRNEAGYEATYYTGSEITEVSLAFDQNMRPTIAIVEGGQPKLIWYDSAVEMEVVTDLAADIKSPRVSMDDKRQTQSANNDIILGYIRGTSLYFAKQRDRYLIEYLLATDALPNSDLSYLSRVGMSTINRFQFEIFTPWSEEQIIADMLSRAPDPATQGTFADTTTIASVLTTDGDTIWGPAPTIVIHALIDPITGEWWVDTDGTPLIEMINLSEADWNG